MVDIKNWVTRCGKHQELTHKMWVCMQGEADLAAALFFKLRSMLVDAHHAKKEGVKATKVGIITPYRQQRKCLQDTVLALCAENAKEVSTKAYT